jgi:hypothetical protein
MLFLHHTATRVNLTIPVIYRAKRTSINTLPIFSIKEHALRASLGLASLMRKKDKVTSQAGNFPHQVKNPERVVTGDKGRMTFFQIKAIEKCHLFMKCTIYQ